MPNKIPNHKKQEEMFVTWQDGDEGRSKALAFATAASALSKADPVVHRSNANYIFRELETNVSTRVPHTRRDYEALRPAEAIPTDPVKIIQAGMLVYRGNPIVRNVVDLMGDFACKGIELIHPNPKIQKFYRTWAKQVRFYDRSERFLNYLYRTGNVIVKRSTAKVTLGDADNLERTLATPDVDVEKPMKVERREIPWRYTYQNPLMVEVLGDELAMFAGEVLYGIRVKESIAKRIQSPKNAIDKKIVSNMPRDIVGMIRNGTKVIPLDPEKVDTYYYKKDDWQIWAEPMTFALYKDVMLLEKMKLADFAALDGAISHIRLWKLGNLEMKILPTEAAISRLAEMLVNNVGGGAMDLIWGPELDVKDITSDVYKFLGNEKYSQVMNDIYAGLGVPPTLTGSANAAGFTNNYISLKTLTERLSYGRQILVDFWEKEIRLVQRAMGFRFPAQVRFDRMSLSDESAEKALLLQLADRDIISIETILERFGELPELEKTRIRKEYRERKTAKLPEKASPWHNPQHDKALEKIIMQQGAVAPSELGVNLQPKKPGEKSSIDIKSAAIQKKAAAITKNNQGKGRPGQGRPLNSADKTKRKKKTVVPRTAASFMTAFAWARKAQEYISKTVTPMFLEYAKKKDVRALSDDEVTDLEEYKYSVLCSLEPGIEMTEEVVASAAEQPQPIPLPCKQLYNEMLSKYAEKFNSEPALSEQRQMKASVYALYKGNFEDSEGYM